MAWTRMAARATVYCILCRIPAWNMEANCIGKDQFFPGKTLLLLIYTIFVTMLAILVWNNNTLVT